METEGSSGKSSGKSSGTFSAAVSGRANESFPVPPPVARIFAITMAAGHETRIVGGAVRDWLVGREIGDIDMAVAAPIDRVAA